MKSSLNPCPIVAMLRDPRAQLKLVRDEHPAPSFAGCKPNSILISAQPAPGVTEMKTIGAEDFFLHLCLVAMHPNVTREILVWIFENSDDESVLSCIASHPDLPLEILAELARDKSKVIRAGAARNKAFF